MKKILIFFYTFILIITFMTPTFAAENTTTFCGYMPFETTNNEPYYVSENGTILKEKPSSGTYVEVLYDSRWDNTLVPNESRLTAYQYININGIVLKSSPNGHYANSIYYTKINVGMTVYFDTDTMRITKVADATVLYTNCPLLTSHSAATVSAYASGGRAYAKGTITYYAPYVETLTGTGSWGWV